MDIIHVDTLRKLISYIHFIATYQETLFLLIFL